MGVVYKARDTRLNRVVAIKVLTKDRVSNSDVRQRFQREAQVLASLNHPCIAAIYGIEDTEGTYDILREKGMIISEFDTTELREAVKPVWVELTADAPKAIKFAEMIGDLIK